MNTNPSRAQIVATIGPASDSKAVLKALMEHQMDVVRFNFSWDEVENRIVQIQIVREVEKECGRRVPIIADLPGPRIQGKEGHTYDPKIASSITAKDREFIKFGIAHGVDYFAASFVGFEVIPSGKIGFHNNPVFV